VGRKENWEIESITERSS